MRKRHHTTFVGEHRGSVGKQSIRRSRVYRGATLLFVSLALVLGIIIGDSASAQSGLNKLSPDLKDVVATGAQTNVKVVIQFSGKPSKALNDLLETQTLVTKKLKNFNQWMVETPATLLSTIAGFPEVKYVSADRETKQLGHLSLTTGANDVRQASGNTAGSTSVPLDGTGIGIAVLDSGIYVPHKSFLNGAGAVRVVAKQDFTGEGTSNDLYGHGSHVVALAAANGRIANAAYAGTSPAPPATSDSSNADCNSN